MPSPSSRPARVILQLKAHRQRWAALTKDWVPLSREASYSLITDPKVCAENFFSGRLLSHGSPTWLLCEDAAHAIHALCLRLQEDLGDGSIGIHVSRETLRKGLREALCTSLSAGGLLTLDAVLERLLRSALAAHGRFTIWHRIDGIALKPQWALSGPSWRIRSFPSAEQKRLKRGFPRDPKARAFFDERLQDTVLGGPCIEIRNIADNETAMDLAGETARDVVSALRAFLLRHHGYGPKARMYYIARRGDPLPRPTYALSRRERTKSVAFHGTWEDRVRVRFDPDRNVWRRMKSDRMMRSLWAIIGRAQPTELEAVVLEALRWIGDGQSDDSPSSALLKYWIAVETLITGENREAGVVRRLRYRTPLAVAQGVRGVDLDGLSADVRKSYDRRCDVAHRGTRVAVKWADAYFASWLAVQTLAGILRLRDRGARTRDDAEAYLVRTALRRRWHKALQ